MFSMSTDDEGFQRPAPFLLCWEMVEYSVHENRRTHRTFPMARPKCLMRDFTNILVVRRSC